jgi:GrpB-like predicted nucleotidyltransferase (UPF0157 family)
MDPVQKYSFKRYRKEYGVFFSEERLRLKKVLGTSAAIQHVGSTAIPGLGGKGILDIAIGIALDKIATSKEELLGGGYEFREKASTKERLFFRRDYPYGHSSRRVHIHLTKYGGRDWVEMIGFRDYLLQHPESVREYASVKKEASLIAHGDGEAYRELKESFIKGTLAKAERRFKKMPS